MAKRKSNPDASEHLDIEELLDRIIKSDLDPSIFSNIDDTGIEVAPNSLDFCINKKFLNLKPYPRQIQIMLNLFEDYCPDCSDPKLVANMFRESIPEILDRVQLLEFGVCPKCKKNRSEWYNKNKFSCPYELAVNMGQRSGKSALVGMSTNYQLHRLVMLKNPAYYYDLLPNSPLHGTFTATTYEQAYDTLYEPFKDYHDASPWWNEYYNFLDYTGQKIGEELYKSLDTIIYFRHKKVSIYAKGPDKRKMRGRTRWMAAIDEIGWFGEREESVKLNADEVYNALERSLSTLRLAAAYRKVELGEHDVLPSYFYNISSPSHANDKIMRLVREGDGDPTKYVCTYPTWEANPKITRRSLEPEFRKDPVAAERDFGAVPPISDSPFISNHEAIKSSFSTTRSQYRMAEIKYMTGTFSEGQPYVYTKLNFHGQDKISSYVLTLDAGHSGNSFGMAIQHWDIDKEQVEVDLVVEASPRDGAVINFNKVFEHSIKPALQHLRVLLIVADRWQSIKILHDAAAEANLNQEQYSLQPGDFQEFKARLLEGRIELPKPEADFKDLFQTNKTYETIIDKKPVLHAALQLFTVREIGRRVLKGSGGLDDDLFRCVVLGDLYINDDEHKYLKRDARRGGWTSHVLGAVRGKSQVQRGIDPRYKAGAGSKQVGSLRSRYKM